MHQWALQHRKPNDGHQHQQSGKKLGWPGKADHECQSRLNLRALLLSAPILWADIGVVYFLGYETSQLWLDAGHPDSLCLSVAGIRRYTNKHLFLQLTSLLSAKMQTLQRDMKHGDRQVWVSLPENEAQGGRRSLSEWTGVWGESSRRSKLQKGVGYKGQTCPPWNGAYSSFLSEGP